MDVYFVLAGEPSLAALSSLDPDRDWAEFVTGERAWVLQTFLRLRAAGLDVHLVDRLPERGIAIFSSKQRRLLLSLQRNLRTRALLVGIREDVRRAPFANFELVQNPSQEKDGYSILVPLWPQPGLLPRDPARGTRIESITYKGFIRNLHPSFTSLEWQQFLTSRSLQWTCDAVNYAGSSSSHDGIAWNNFRETDLILAVRPENKAGHPHKPATKLYNAWMAGTPALLGPEIAYRALRRSPLDYIEVTNWRDAAAAVDSLLGDPHRYRAMIEHGLSRAQEFSVAAMTQHWRTIVEDTLPVIAKRRMHRQPRPLWLKQTMGRLTRIPNDARDALLGRRSAPPLLKNPDRPALTSDRRPSTRGSILVLSYDPQLPSFRYRMQPAVDLLVKQQWQCRIHQLAKRSYGFRILQLADEMRAADCVVLTKIQLTPPEAWLLRQFARVIVLDVDDAIYVRKPRKPGEPADDTRWRRRKFEATCRITDLIIAGNDVLARTAKPHAQRVEVLPTPIDVRRYARAVPERGRPATLVWIGRPENLKYLELVRPALTRLKTRWPQLRLRVVCSEFPQWNDSIIDPVMWSPEAEVRALVTADIGIMPLYDDEWTRGKCAFKLLQYAAAGLPCIASDVGANREAVIDGKTGYLVPVADDWDAAIEALLTNVEQREAFGRAGHAHMLEWFDTRVIIPQVAQLLAGMAGAASRDNNSLTHLSHPR